MKFTFGIASYNNANNLILTINTINSAMKNFRKLKYEIIVVDDHSLDETEKKIRKFKGKNKSIRYFRNSINLGFPKSILKAAKKGKGTYFKILHSSNIESAKDLNIYVKNIEKYKLIIPYIIDTRIFFRRFLSKFSTIILNFFSGQNFKYYQSPLMCDRKKFIYFYPENNPGSFFLSTIIFRLSNFYNNEMIYEFGLKPKFKTGSTAINFKNLISLIFTILSILNFRLRRFFNNL